MAQILCMTEGHGPATFVGTFFPDGSGVRLCDECMPNFCAAVFQRMTGVDMSPALYLASEEGQDGLPDPDGSPEEVAAPSTASPTGDEAAEVAAQDADEEGAHGGDPTLAGANEPGAQPATSDAPGDVAGTGDSGSPNAPPSDPASVPE
jgi:hypothetical protein